MNLFIHILSFLISKTRKNLASTSLLLILFQYSAAMELPAKSEITLDVDEIDKIAINHSILSYYAYEQHSNTPSWAPNNPKLGPSKEWTPLIEEIKKDWIFREIEGETGFDFCLCPSLIGLIGYNSILNIMTISYRGSQKFSDWANNLNSSRCAPDGVKTPFDLHEGYVKIFEHSKDSLLRIIGKTLTENINNTQNELTVVCTGHSLGGAVGTIAAYYLLDQHYFSNIHLRVFATPPIGPSIFDEWIKGHLSSAKVFIRETDIFPSWSPSCLGLTLIGNQIILPSYGDSVASHQVSHDNRKYRRGIYEALGLEYTKLYRRFYVYPFGIIKEW